MRDVEPFQKLLRAGHAAISIVTHEEAHAREVVATAASREGRSFRVWSVVRGVGEGVLVGGRTAEATEHPAAALYHFAHDVTAPAVCVALDLVPHLEDDRTLRAWRECIARFREEGSTLVMIDHDPQMPPVVRSEATPFTVSLPGENEIDQIVRAKLRALGREQAIEVRIPRRVYAAIIKNLSGLARSQIEQVVADAALVDGHFDERDVNHILAAKRRALRSDGQLEYIESPADLSSIGGLDHLKQWLVRRESALGEEAIAFGLVAPRGVLLLGVQGAGKSLCAKAVAAAWNRPLFRLDPGELYDRYIGESERRLRETLAQAEQMAPMVLWLDEIEKGFASAASQSVDGGLSRRMFGTLLTWMQERTAPVFIVATANDIESLPPELLRKGRFDEIFFIDVPGREARREILAIHLRARRRDPALFDLDALAAASDGYTGAEIEQAIIAALHDAFAAGSELTTDSVERALRGSPPLTVTMAEDVARLRAWARNRCVLAG